MKVYVFGGDRDTCIELANQLNDSGVTALIGKIDDDPREVSGKIGRGVDAAIMLSNDPIKASVQANRDPKIRAAVCYNQKSLKAAAGEDVNMFILEPDSLERLDFSAISSAPSPQAERTPPPQRFQERPAKEPIRPPAAVAQAPRFKPQPPPKPEQKKMVKDISDEEDDDAPRSPKSGIKGKLRDIFGIED
jgi:hypothetical protein